MLLQRGSPGFPDTPLVTRADRRAPQPLPRRRSFLSWHTPTNLTPTRGRPPLPRGGSRRSAPLPRVSIGMTSNGHQHTGLREHRYFVAGLTREGLAALDELGDDHLYNLLDMSKSLLFCVAPGSCASFPATDSTRAIFPCRVPRRPETHSSSQRPPTTQTTNLTFRAAQSLPPIGPRRRRRQEPSPPYPSRRAARARLPAAARTAA